MNLTPAYFQVWRKIQTDLAAKGVDFAVFFSVYTLTPHGTYPKQFQEAVEAVDYVVKEEGRRPQDVLIAGDSAGGNMCLGVISHLSHPSEQAPKLDIEGNLAGMIMVSPWVSFDTTWPTMTRNAARDSLNTGTLKKWSETYLNGKTSDNYSEPGLATAEWWESARVDHTIVTVGTDEVFLDAIRSWGDKFKVCTDLAFLGKSLGRVLTTRRPRTMKLSLLSQRKRFILSHSSWRILATSARRDRRRL